MPKIAPHVAPLPADLKPTRSSTELINGHVQRLKDNGVPQKAIARTLGFGDNYVSMLKAGEDLPLPRVIAFAAAARLSPAERFELLDTRLMELHGGRGDFDVEALAAWGAELFSPTGDEGALMAMWREATEPAPHLLVGLLANPAAAARVKAVVNAPSTKRLTAL
jgi:hypothetical protein